MNVKKKMFLLEGFQIMLKMCIKNMGVYSAVLE